MVEIVNIKFTAFFAKRYSTYLMQNLRFSILNDMTDEKIELLAKFFTKFRSIKDQSLDELFELDDYWYEIYKENRIKLDFDEAQSLANKMVIRKVLNDK